MYPTSTVDPMAGMDHGGGSSGPAGLTVDIVSSRFQANTPVDLSFKIVAAANPAASSNSWAKPPSLGASSVPAVRRGGQGSYGRIHDERHVTPGRSAERQAARPLRFPAPVAVVATVWARLTLPLPGFAAGL